MPRKPWVTSRPVLAPFSSSSALVPTVVPWQKNEMSPAETPWSVSSLIFVEKHEIGKRAAGIHGNSILGHGLNRLALNF
jgi:hypothetical protein